MKKFIKKILEFFSDLIEKMQIRRSKNAEKRKYRSKKRKNIYETVNLTTEQKKAIDNLYKNNYGKKIPYTWHRHYTAFTGKFDVNYFPELLYIPEFERFMNENVSAARVFADKNVLPLLAKGVGIKMPKAVISVANGVYRDVDGNIINLSQGIEILKQQGDLFVKPTVDSCSGNGCEIVNFATLSEDEIVSVVKSFGPNAVFQEKIKCHESISKIYSASVNTFRVITYIWKGEIKYCPIIMRVGQGGNFLDNAHAGGMFVAVNDDGSLGDRAFTEFKKEYSVHPDTGIKFSEVKIPLISKVIECARKIHGNLPQMGCVNWDFTIDENGDALLIEANTMFGSPWMLQMAHGCGPFGENTPEILRWMKKLRKLPKSKRNKYKFGNF